jgi:hypothetical protein
MKEGIFQTHLQRLRATVGTDYSLWKATKRLKQPTQRILPIRCADQIWGRSDKEKANTFAGHLEKTFKPNELPQNEDLETEIHKAPKEPLQIKGPIKFLTPKGIRNIIQEDLDSKTKSQPKGKLKQAYRKEVSQDPSYILSTRATSGHQTTQAVK